MPKRAAFYIDGFNLYHAIDALAKPHLKWFSIHDYAQFVTASNGEDLVKVQYFSALAYHRAASVPRHQLYLRALKSTGVAYTLGQFKTKPRSCNRCGANWIGHEEKETDVNIAIQLVEDAVDGLIDVCYVVSADSDLAPAIRLLSRKFPTIEYVPVSPPRRRHAAELLALATRNLIINEAALIKNRLPEKITDASGDISCPPEYALPTPPTPPSPSTP